MATDTAATPVNGNYGSQQAFGTVESHGSSQTQGIATTTNVNGATGAQGPSATAGNPSSGANEGNSGVSKDEVGWYFVEQYYTTLSKNPEKLHVSLCQTRGLNYEKMFIKGANLRTALLLETITVCVWG